MDDSLTVPDLLAARAEADPARVAMLNETGRSMTYAEWRSRAESVARGLVRLGVQKGDRIGLVFSEPEWIDFAVAYCAVHLAGAVAVPLSARRAPAEISELTIQCGAKLVLRADSLPSSPAAPTQLPPPPSPSDVAQILFTSGTTGQPKGVVATHANLTAGQRARPRVRALAHSGHLIHAMPIGTNAGQTMLLNALTAAPATLAMTAYSSEDLCRLIETHRIGTAFLVPAMAIDLVASGALGRHDLTSLQLLGSTAAALPPATAMALLGALPDVTVVNYYTSTESAPAQTTMVFDRSRPESVGRAVNLEDIRVTDGAGNPLQAGETGVIWLRSPVAPREYLDDSAATAEVFQHGWTRMGDVGHLDEAGYLHLADRESDLIVTGAFKVSSLHVEAELHAHPAIIDAAVVAVPHPVMGAMVGAVAVTGRPIDIDEVRAFLRPRLAGHEIPSRLVSVESLPRNEAGKVLKRQLGSLFATSQAQRSELSTPAQRVLAEAWATALNRAAVGADDDFFVLGGDSLRAAQVASLVEQRLQRRMRGSDVLDHPVLRRQAAWLETAPAIVTAPVRRRDDSGPAPLTGMQRFWVRWMAESGRNRVIPMHVAIRVEEPFDPALARRCLVALAERHEVLRMVVDGQDSWRVSPDPQGVVECTEADGGNEIELACRFVESRTDAVMRSLTVHSGPDRSLFVLSLEHMACDGWSLGLLLREFALLYSALRAGHANPLRPVALRPSDVARWDCDQWPLTREHWRAELGDTPVVPNPLPGQRIDPAEYAGAAYEFTVDEIARPHGTTAMQAALAAWASVLRDHTGSDQLAVVMALTGRVRREFENVVGCLIQQPILRLDLERGDLLGRVRQALNSADDHQFYPFHEFAHLAPHPAFFFYEAWGRPAHLPGLRSSPVALPPELATRWPLPRPDLSPPRLRVTERPDGRWSGCLVYNKHAVAEPAVSRLAHDFSERCQRLGR
ncbi:MAG TPA: AMP-binding protein [Candidatus Limnocylindrales bacterium]